MVTQRYVLQFVRGLGLFGISLFRFLSLLQKHLFTMLGISFSSVTILSLTFIVSIFAVLEALFNPLNAYPDVHLDKGT